MPLISGGKKQRSKTYQQRYRACQYVNDNIDLMHDIMDYAANEHIQTREQHLFLTDRDNG
jgi:hypothetical protein